MSSDRYKELGASATKEGIHRALEQAGVAHSGEYFAQLLPDIAGDLEMRSFIHADGAGTKSIVAYLRFRDGEPASVFRHLAADALVMNLDDVYCLGEPTKLCLSNAIARNARLVPDDAIEAIVGGYHALSSRLASEGIEIMLGGGETADCGDVVRTLLVDAVLAGRIAKRQLISPRRISVGDAILALSGSGTARYEEQENSSIGSNGLTLARHCLLNKAYAERYPECVDEGIDPSIAYVGPYSLSDRPSSLGMTIGEALGSPTRTYAPVLKRVYQQLADDVHGVIHLTGGAHTKVLRFVEGKRIVKENLFPAPAIFRLIQEHGRVSWQEMYRVFNMGQRVELYLPAARVAEACSIAAEFNIDARQVGVVEASKDSSSEVLLRGEHGEFRYHL